MCKFKLFSIAAAALMMVACSTEDLTQQTQIKTGEMHFTATIAAPSGTTRTTYEQDGDNINVKWVVGDEIALIHNKVKDVATVKTINSDGSATITGYVTGATNNADVTLYYPAARISGVTSDGNPVFDGSVEGKISSQDGTPKYIQDNLDFRVGISTFSVNGSEATLKEAAKMLSQIAIWKLKLKDNASALLEASKVSIEMGSGDYTTSATATLSSPKSELTIATQIPRPIDNVRPITIEATVGNDTYVYSQDNVDVTPGKYYQSTVTMTKVIDLSKLTADYEAKDGDVLTGTLGANVKISIADGATVTLDGVTITGENHPRYTWAGITCEGDATIILKDGSTNTVKGFYAFHPGIDVPGDAENPANNKTLTIKGTGSLTASSNGQGAGIGGGYGIACGNIKIEGGTITATGSSDAAGIGSANNSSCGSITISGGTITATGGNEGAGIGSGYKAKCGDITISGGTIEATGGTDAAGIGSGYDNGASCGDITISGGTVTATGGIGGAGIGSGYEGSCVDITISGGTVTATGRNEGAGIGSSFDGKCGNITITTGVTKVTATKGSDSPNSIGIGSGRSGSCGTVTIGCTLDNDGKPVGGTTGAITTNPYTYPVTAITVTWNSNDITGSGNSFTKDGVTITASMIDFENKTFYDGGTFTTTLGNFTKIEVTGADGPSGTGWSGSTWTGNASSVSFSGNINDYGAGTIKFVFTIEPTN